MIDNQCPAADGLARMLARPGGEVLLEIADERFFCSTALRLDLYEIPPSLIADEQVRRPRTLACLIQIEYFEVRVLKHSRDGFLELSATPVQQAISHAGRSLPRLLELRQALGALLLVPLVHLEDRILGCDFSQGLPFGCN